MKRTVCSLLAMSFSLCSCCLSAGCTRDAEKNDNQIVITSADELVRYLKGYYYFLDVDQSQTLEEHYLLHKNYKLTQTYSKYSGNTLIPSSENVTADGLPYSVVFIGKDGDIYKKNIHTNYVADANRDLFKREVALEFYYKTDTHTGYTTETVDRQRFKVYPQFEARQRYIDEKSYWTFPAADEFNERRNAFEFGTVGFMLGQETINNLFKLNVTDYTVPALHVDESRFEKLDISQNGDIVSFEIIYNDAKYSCSAKGTLNVTEIDFRYEYNEIRREADSAVIESACTFGLVSLADDEAIDFNFDRQFQLNPNIALI